MISVNDFDSANVFHKSFPGGVKRNVVVQSESLGVKRMLTQIHYEDGITNPDYEVVRDWSALYAAIIYTATYRNDPEERR